ncbi:MaoC family dehydratase [Romboutsia sedimentorum]|uniref:MaoC family dehydratase n=1 Tax=Romboutsia sedimentorum TaxID=1368474 RepID=UPI0024DED0B2|nr:MaoC family dehydratase [Romboutsia sedimentorum]MDK2585462.1 MaoC family dehydratase [Romboutsia sedimentorum]
MENIYYIGQKSDTTKTISEYDVYSFAGITGDFNYAHINEEYAKNTKFETRIAHGMISAGLISSVLGMKLPGNGTIYLNQSLDFKKAVKIGDTIKAEVEIIEIIDKKKFTILKLKTVCYNQFGEIVTEGIAQVIPPSDK